MCVWCVYHMHNLLGKDMCGCGWLLSVLLCDVCVCDSTITDQRYGKSVPRTPAFDARKHVLLFTQSRSHIHVQMGTSMHNTTHTARTLTKCRTKQKMFSKEQRAQQPTIIEGTTSTLSVRCGCVCVCVSGMCTYSTLHATALVERTTHIHTHSLSRSARAMFSRIVSATHTHTQPCMHCDCDCARRRENPYHTCVLYYACVCTWRIRLSSSMLPFLLLPIVHVFSLSVTVDEVGSNQPARGSSKFQSLIPKTRHIYIIALHRCSHIVCVSRSIRVVIHRGIDRQSVAFTP